MSATTKMLEVIEPDKYKMQSAIVQIVVSLIVPIVLIIGTFFTLQADVRHLGDRLAIDEQQLGERIHNLEIRQRSIEITTSERLATIETKLTGVESILQAIEIYIMEIRQNVHP